MCACGTKHRKTRIFPRQDLGAVLIPLPVPLPGSCTLGQGSGNVLGTGMHSVCVHSAGCQRTCEHEKSTEGRKEERMKRCPDSSVCKHSTNEVGPTPSSHIFRSSNPIDFTTSEDGDPSHLPFVICHCLKRVFPEQDPSGLLLP